MAGNQVLVTLAGDSTSLEKSMRSVGDGAKTMAGKVDAAGAGVRGGFDNMAEGIDNSERKFRGIGDTVTGTSDIMQGFKDGNLVGVAMGFADLAGGITDFVVPAIKSLAARFGLMTGATAAQATATEGAAVAQTGLNTALMANPIGLVVAAIAALVAIGFVVVKNWDTIKSAFAATWGWIKDRFSDLVGLVSGLGAGIGRAAAGMWDGIRDAFRAALNWIIDRWNGLEFKVPGFKVGPVGFDGFTLGVPDIPKLHTGGTVPGVPGSEVPIMALAGETVSPIGAAGAPAVIQLVLDGRILTEVVYDGLIAKQRRTGLGFT